MIIYRVTEEEKYNFGSKKNPGYCESGFQKICFFKRTDFWNRFGIKIS